MLLYNFTCDKMNLAKDGTKLTIFKNLNTFFFNVNNGNYFNTQVQY